MKTIVVDGKEHIAFLEDGHGDGGLVVNVLVPGASGVFRNFRTWHAPSERATALAQYDAIDEAAVVAVAELIVERDERNAKTVADEAAKAEAKRAAEAGTFGAVLGDRLSEGA